jgi:hypothetical protein
MDVRRSVLFEIRLHGVILITRRHVAEVSKVMSKVRAAACR